MKYLIIIFLFITLHTHATNYYVSNTGSDAAAGTSEGTAWQTISKVNTVWAAGTFAPGDQILFKRGDTFTGTLTISEDGGPSNHIIVGAYGAGAKPILTGSSTVIAWTSLGSNIYESTSAVSTLTSLNMLTIDGVQYAMGRYPNAGTTNNGYLTIDSHTSDSVIFDAATLSSTTNWTGARLVVRVNAFFMDTSTIEAHSSNRIDVLSSRISSSFIDGYGFFIQNDARTLDQHGEWYYDRTSKKLKIYLSSDPSNYTIKVATQDNNVVLSSDDYITFQDLDVQYSNDIAFSVTTSTNITIYNCNIQFHGNKAVSSRSSGSNNLIVRGNTISECGNFGVDGRSMGSNRIVANTIKKIGLFPGMGGFANGASGQHRYAIHCDAQGSILDSNRIDSVAYVGIRFYGNNSTVQYNYISNHCMVMQDGGGIYTYNGHMAAGNVLAGRVVKYNIVRDGIGSPEGTTVTYRKAYGIYFDDNSNGIECSNNVIFDQPSWGIHHHNGWNTTFRNNTVYNCEGEASAPAQVLFNDDNIHVQQMTGNVFKGNILVARTSTQKTLYLYGSSASAASINSMGTIDSNYYARPVSDSMILTGRNLGGSVVQYSRTSWKAAYNHDDYSPWSPVTFSDPDSTDYYIVFIYNATASPVTEDLIDGASYTTVTGDDYSESVELAPYTSLVLLRTPDPPEPPVQTRKVYKHTNGKVIKSQTGKILVTPDQ
jgi:parallel beta-helix repeat protein